MILHARARFIPINIVCREGFACLAPIYQKTQGDFMFLAPD